MEQEEKLLKDINELKERIAQLEGMLAEALAPLGQLNDMAGRYLRLMDIYSKHGSLSPDVVVPGLKDSMSKEILQVLARSGSMNISQITDSLRGTRGTASRRIVRERLAELEGMGAVERSEERTPRYSLTEEVTRKWAQMLGFVK